MNYWCSHSSQPQTWTWTAKESLTFTEWPAGDSLPRLKHWMISEFTEDSLSVTQWKSASRRPKARAYLRRQTTGIDWKKIIKSSASDLHWRPDLTRRQAGKRVVLRHISIRLLTESWGLVLWRDGGKKKKKLHNNGRQNSSFPVQQQQGSVAERDVPAGLLQNHETVTIRRILFYRQDDFWRVGVPACSPQRPGRGGINFLLSPLGSSLCVLLLRRREAHGNKRALTGGTSSSKSDWLAAWLDHSCGEQRHEIKQQQNMQDNEKQLTFY